MLLLKPFYNQESVTVLKSSLRPDQLWLPYVDLISESRMGNYQGCYKNVFTWVLYYEDVLFCFADDHNYVKHSFSDHDAPMEGVDDTALFQQSSVEEGTNENDTEMSESLDLKLDLSPSKGEQKDEGLCKHVIWNFIPPPNVSSYENHFPLPLSIGWPFSLRIVNPLKDCAGNWKNFWFQSLPF